MSHTMASAAAFALDPAPLAELEDAELCELLVGLFAGEASVRVEQITAAIAAGDEAAARALAHRLEGTAATIGAGRVADICGRIARSPSAAGATGLGELLRASLDETLAALDAYLATIAPERPR